MTYCPKCAKASAIGEGYHEAKQMCYSCGYQGPPAPSATPRDEENAMRDLLRRIVEDATTYGEAIDDHLIKEAKRYIGGYHDQTQK